MMIEEEPVSDDSGNVTVTMSVADDVSLPVTMVLKGSEGRLSLTVTYDGQSVKMKSGTYRVTKATDGNGEKAGLRRCTYHTGKRRGGLF